MSDLTTLADRTEAARLRLEQRGDADVVAQLFRSVAHEETGRPYSVLPAELHTQVRDLGRQRAAELPRLLRLLVLHALADSVHRLRTGTPIVDDLRATTLRTLALIVRAVETEADDRYVLTDDRFVKDLQVSRLRLLALGAQLVDPYRGFSRKPFLLGGGALGVPRAAYTMWRVGGNAPWHEFHTYDLAMRFFSAKAWEECLRLCVPLLRATPGVKGIFAIAWWYDPVVVKLTPNIAFPYEVSQRFGATFLRMPREPMWDELAVYRSPERAALVANGTYVPTPYIMLFPRDVLLRAF